ncbi:MAG: hypothetical protein WBA73_14000 [Devosia sp.]
MIPALAGGKSNIIRRSIPMTINNTTRAPATAMPRVPTPEVQLEIDVAHLARLASILADMVADGFARQRARDIDGPSVTLTWQEEGILDLEFAAEELRHRTKKAVVDCEALLERRGLA